MTVARVNVEQKALTDPRFNILGSHLRPLTSATQEAVEAAFGLYQMVRVWNYCMERGLLEVPARDLDALYPGLSEAMLDAQLSEKVPRSRTGLVRIKGGEGRLDWLESARATGRENGPKGGQYGSLGGRPRKDGKPPVGVSNNPVGGFPNNPPPAPAPAPAPAQKTKEEPPSEVPAAKPAKVRVPREPNPLFDAVAEITGADPKASGRFIGVVQAALAKAEPPYTPDDVREFGRQFAVLCPWSEGRRPTPGEVEKYIGLLRSGQGQPQRPQSRGFETPQDRIRANLIDVCEDES